ncbi:hypothetical protein ACJIZ3_019487 [Penstemon smallii]|uniref:Rad60/SUMO-like domain-containing protein n=1 Tax=Penstemon smallii TaxID=265156 RepID=A0ABD3T1U3_9LAMI
MFSVAVDKKLQRLFMDYCRAINLDYNMLVFLFDGKRLKSSMTPVLPTTQSIQNYLVHNTHKTWKYSQVLSANSP